MDRTFWLVVAIWGGLAAMTVLISVDGGVIRMVGEVGVRVGMLLGRYLDDPVLVGIVAEHVVTGWLAGRDGVPAETGVSSVEQWWNAYVEVVEAAAGGVDCATDDDLRRVWADHARCLLQQSLIDPANVDSGR
jgi:hypothetical protein